jgi:hypothetical protein
MHFLAIQPRNQRTYCLLWIQLKIHEQPKDYQRDPYKTCCITISILVCETRSNCLRSHSLLSSIQNMFKVWTSVLDEHPFDLGLVGWLVLNATLLRPKVKEDSINVK